MKCLDLAVARAFAKGVQLCSMGGRFCFNGCWMLLGIHDLKLTQIPFESSLNS